MRVSPVLAWHGRAAIPIGTDKAGPTALRRTSPFTPALRDGFPHDAKPDDEMPDALDGGQPSYDQAAALYSARGPDQELWREERGGTVTVDHAGLTRWEAGTGGRHVLVHRVCPPEILARWIEALMIAPPAE